MIWVFLLSNKFFLRIAKIGTVFDEKLITLFASSLFKLAIAHSKIQDNG